MRKETVDWLASLRARGNEPGTVFVAVRARSRSIVIYPEEIAARNDEQLLAFIRHRFAHAAKPFHTQRDYQLPETQRKSA